MQDSCCLMMKSTLTRAPHWDMAKCKNPIFWQNFTWQNAKNGISGRDLQWNLVLPLGAGVRRGNPGCAIKEKDRITEVMRSLKFQMIA